MIRLEKFGKENYDDLISWIDSEEALMQFAGPLFTYPLNAEQLDKSLEDDKRIAFRIVDIESNKGIGHAEIYVLDDTAKIGRILIGDTAHRGKGLCPTIVRLLLAYAFANLNREKIELNVFDWNHGAIKCYEKVGFTINPDKTLLRKVKDQTWTAINMTIDKTTFENSIMVK
jgi:RimJ/RimL family protein N-acetyltransferase